MEEQQRSEQPESVHLTGASGVCTGQAALCADTPRFESIEVTQEQYDRVEALWDILTAGRNSRKVGQSATFRDCVARVLGFAPPDNFALVVAEAA